MQSYSALRDQKVQLLLFAALVRKLGGHVEITQADIDAVAYQMLDETVRHDGSLDLRLRTPAAN